MATIAKGMITLSSVNDAFSVSLSPSSCVINAKWNGEDPDYSNAYSDLSVYRGDVAVPFEIIDMITTHIGNCDIADLPHHVKRIKILEIEDGALSGKVSFQIKCGDDFTTWVNLPFTVVRETSMLDWILDWEGREKTEIAGEHIITPKIFVGKSEDGGKLTGTYIGPSFDHSGRVGVFGYSAGKEIFHLDDTGGMIGGWCIEDGRIQTSDGVLKIFSEGTIISAPDGEMAWQLLKDGSATFAGGNVHFYANGDADFKGTITSTSGKIGGWVIGEHSLYNQAILIDSEAKFIGIRRVNNLYFIKEPTREKFYENIKQDGGIAIFSQNNISYGIECWVPTIKDNDYNNPVDGIRVFKLGDSNEIAGWNFDGEALWRGVRNNTARQNTSAEGSITIGSAGMRGMNWYIDHDGEISFVEGLLHFDKNGGTIAGWTLNQNMFATTKAALVSASGYTGLYLSNSALPESYINYGSHIRDKGGIYLTTSAIGAMLRGSDSQGNLLFQLTSSVSFIGGWWFSESCLFTGISPTPTGEFATQGNITLSPDGLRGHKFRLEASGAGAIAGGKISWDDDGNMTFDSSVTLSWAQITETEAITNKLTKIDANGIYTGTISANNITAGTISTVTIESVNKTWALNNDGSGHLANGQISWQANGTTNLMGWIFKNNRLESQNGGIYLDGLNGVVRVAGTIQLSTGYSGEWDDVNIFYIKPFTGNRTISLGYDSEDVGKVVRIYNGNAFGGDAVIVYLHEFPIIGGGWVFDSSSASILPQETVEFTCFQIAENRAMWAITNRFGLDEFRKGTIGRFPRMLAMGTVRISNDSTDISGRSYDGKAMSQLCTIERIATGKCKISFNSDWKIPTEGVYVFLTGKGDSVTNAQIISQSFNNTSKELQIGITRGSGFVDGDCEFMIQSGTWYYDVNYA